jgi:hypothetical protein
MWNSLETSALGVWIDSSSWAYPALLTAHGLGMAVVVGLTVMVSLRVLGFPRSAPLSAYHATWPYLLAAFVVNAASGAALFVADAAALAANRSFQIKLVSIVIGCVIVWRLYATVTGPAARADDAEFTPGPFGERLIDGSAAFAVPGSARLLAAAAVLVWWLSVIVSGRLVAYLAAAY